MGQGGNQLSAWNTKDERTEGMTGVTGQSGLNRRGNVHRTTGETDVRVTLGLDGSGRCTVNTGVPFLDHMLHQLASHGLIDLEISAKGDTHIDDHHTILNHICGQKFRHSKSNNNNISLFCKFSKILSMTMS